MFHENVLPGTLGRENWHHCKTQSGPAASGQGTPTQGDTQEEKPFHLGHGRLTPPKPLTLYPLLKSLFFLTVS